MPIGSGIAVDRRSDRSWYSGQRLQSFESTSDGEINQILQDRSRIRYDALARCHQALGHKAQHYAAESGIGNDEICPAANDNEIEAALARY